MKIPYAKLCGAQNARPPKSDGNSGAQNARPPGDGRDGILPSAKNPEHHLAVGNMPTLPQRKHPTHGVFIDIGSPTIVFLTVCTDHKTPWLVNEHVHAALLDVWTKSDAWSVGYYLLMPDHIHLFCSPHKMEFTLKSWVSHWKRKFSCIHLPEAGQWQRDYWDTRLRRQDNYRDKWEYVRQNPVRKGLVPEPEDWPYQGVMNELRW